MAGEWQCKKCGGTERKLDKKGRGAGCKACARLASRKYYADHKAELQRRARAYYGANRDACLDYMRRRRQENPALFAARGLSFRERHRDSLLAYHRSYYVANLDARRAYHSFYRESHREELQIKAMRRFLADPDHARTIQRGSRNRRKSKHAVAALFAALPKLLEMKAIPDAKLRAKENADVGSVAPVRGTVRADRRKHPAAG